MDSNKSPIQKNKITSSDTPTLDQNAVAKITLYSVVLLNLLINILSNPRLVIANSIVAIV
ncbi:hypothetical protein EKTHUN627_24960 [Enterobacter kobei]|nr:hypothetical protein EKTHUN627_24960 [Enterobacter kobei]